jgi:hypothetical protein
VSILNARAEVGMENGSMIMMDMMMRNGCAKQVSQKAVRVSDGYATTHGNE